MYCPLLSRTALILVDNELTNDSQYCTVISVVQTRLMASTSDAADVGRSWATFCFMLVHRFSMGLRSGLDPGHGPRTSIPWSAIHLETLAVRWQGAPSCWKIVHSWISMWGWRLSCSTDRYTLPLMVVFLGMNQIAPLPDDEKQAQTMVVGACFTVGTTYFRL